MDQTTKECYKHGSTDHALDSSGRYRCKKCRVDAVTRRRAKIKRMAVEYKGSECADCGLITEHVGVYDFHHLDPGQKDFAIAKKGYTRSWEKTKQELDKCVMLCANCHRIRHSIEGP